MHKRLIQLAFAKAKKERKKKGDISPSQQTLAGDISNYIEEKHNFSLGERSYRDYFKDAKKLQDKNEDIVINQLKVVIGLYTYLGYTSYEDFTGTTEHKNFTQRLIVLIKKHKFFLFIFAIITVIIISIGSVQQQRWMVWEKDHYTEVPFDLKKYDLGQLKLYKEERIKYFKKIVNPDCNTVFFDKKGDEKVWYWKKRKGPIEVYTSLGLHPETGETLKAITPYMIKKYICHNYQMKK